MFHGDESHTRTSRSPNTSAFSWHAGFLDGRNVRLTHLEAPAWTLCSMPGRVATVDFDDVSAISLTVPPRYKTWAACPQHATQHSGIYFLLVLGQAGTFSLVPGRVS